MSCKNISNRLFLLGLLLLGGCAAPPIKPPSDALARAVPQAFQLNGRIAVRYGEEGFSGNLRWQHGAQGDEILLLSPLGQTVARIERDAAGVKLDVSDGHYTAQDAAELTEHVLGWRLPLDGMQYWVTGRAAPDGAASVTRDEAMNLTRLRQQDWDIEYRDYRQEDRFVLPARVVMRNGTLELKLVVDEWILP